MKCEICDKFGHTSKTCRAHLKCDYCGWNGHTIDVCRKLHKMNSTGGKPYQQECKNFTSKVHHVDANKATPPTSFNLIVEQYQNLMALLNSKKPNTLANHVGSASAMSDLSSTTFCASIFGKGMC